MRVEFLGIMQPSDAVPNIPVCGISDYVKKREFYSFSMGQVVCSGNLRRDEKSEQYGEIGFPGQLESCAASIATPATANF